MGGTRDDGSSAFHDSGMGDSECSRLSVMAITKCPIPEPTVRVFTTLTESGAQVCPRTGNG